MSTEEQRQRNRQKQKRWRQGHRDLLRARYHRKKLLTVKIDFRHLRADFRTFELGDPRDAPDLVPRLIGYCRVEQRPVWGALWTLRNISNARWALWFRELEVAGLEPVELSGLVVGVPVPFNLRFIKKCVALRVRGVCEMARDTRNPPPWLCNEVRVGGKGRCRRIGRVLPDGVVERFKGLREASRAVKMSTDWINHLASTCSVDASGSTWFDD